MNRRPSAAALFTGAALLGTAGGWLLARRHDRSHRHDLFSSRIYQRFAALGWIEREGDLENVPLLRDYLAWEPAPALRQRARRVIAVLAAEQ
ncbi:MAG TPA: hypothetical protein VGL65_05215 [Gemmatimonadales bacterium]|jgi:hypothetical protein